MARKESDWGVILLEKQMFEYRVISNPWELHVNT